VWSVSLSAPCFSLFASVRYWFCWFWSLCKKRHLSHSPPLLYTSSKPHFLYYNWNTHVQF
jgi:hypothetical protein